MRYVVIMKPSAKQNSIEEIDQNIFKISVTEVAIENRANNAMLKLIAKHFKVAQGRCSIKYGAKSRRKIVEVED